MEAEVHTETYGVAVADGVNHKCLDLAEVLAEVTVEAWAVSADSQEWVAEVTAVASEVDTECLKCLDLVEALVEAWAVVTAAGSVVECRITEWVKRTNGSVVEWVAAVMVNRP